MKIREFFEEGHFAILLSVGGIAFIFGFLCHFIYKVAAGFYHLLDKLIDKL
jgi:hypothetical protein